jgi:hypothetical protein
VGLLNGQHGDGEEAGSEESSRRSAEAPAEGPGQQDRQRRRQRRQAARPEEGGSAIGLCRTEQLGVGQQRHRGGRDPRQGESDGPVGGDLGMAVAQGGAGAQQLGFVGMQRLEAARRRIGAPVEVPEAQGSSGNEHEEQQEVSSATCHRQAAAVTLRRSARADHRAHPAPPILIASMTRRSR